MWKSKYKKLGMPDPPIKPCGYDAYVMTKYNLTVAQQRMNAVGLPYNGIDSMRILRSIRPNAPGFAAPEIPLNEDSDDDVTYAGFAMGHHRAYGAFINSYDRDALEDV